MNRLGYVARYVAGMVHRARRGRARRRKEHDQHVVLQSRFQWQSKQTDWTTVERTATNVTFRLHVLYRAALCVLAKLSEWPELELEQTAHLLSRFW